MPQGNALAAYSILVRPVDWTDAPFANLQALPTNAQPLTVWQNEDTALAVIAAGLRRVITEELPQLSSSAPRAALPAIWNIPYPRNLFFLGRDTELAQIRQQLQIGQTMALSQPQAISGLGGIGKTQLALEYAYRYRQDYTVVLWARAENTDALISSYVAIATLLQLPKHETKEQEVIVQAVKIWLQTHSGWLLVLDNADELKLLPGFLPPSLGGHLILTTRAVAIGRLALRLQIETLLPEQGALFLLRRVGFIAADMELSQASQEERKLALQISQELGGLPLALDQAGAYLEETGMDLARYWTIYQQHRAYLLQQRGGLVADHPASVTTTWSLSFQRVEEKNPAAVEILRLCAYLSPDAIPEEIITANASVLGPVLAPVAADTFLLNQAIKALLAYSLVRRDPREKTLSIHRLVQAVLQDTCEKEERHIWRERAMFAVNVSFPHAEQDTWPQCERLLPHALLTAHYIETEQFINEEAGRLLYKTASYLQDRARYSEAEPLYQRALRIREQQLGSEHPDVASALTALAILYSDQGKYAESELLYQRALHIWERSLGPEHPDVASALNGLAILYFEQGQYAEAELLHQRALHIRERSLGPEHPQVAYPLYNLANLYKAQVKYAEAELLYQRALHIRERSLGPEHPQVAYPLNGLANLYRMQGKYAESEPLYQRALHIWKQSLGPEHPEVAYPLYNLAILYSDQSKYAEAEPLSQRALHIWEQSLGPEHRQVAYALSGLADLYFEQGKYAEAEPLYQRALTVSEQALGPEHPDIAIDLDSLASLYSEQGKYEQAEPLYQRALHIWEQVRGPEHLDTAVSLSGLAAIYLVQGKYEQAEPLYQRALHIREQVRGPEHPDVAYALSGLADLYFEQGKYAEAEPLYQRALTISEQALGPEHLEVAYPLNGLANLYFAQSKDEQAVLLYQRALHIWEQQLGREHLNVTSSLTGLANLYSEQGKYEQAEPLYQRILHIWKQRLTSDPYDAAAHLSRGYAYLYLRKREDACVDFARCADLQPGSVNATWMVVYSALSKQHPGIEIAERLEVIAEFDPQSHEAYVCQGVAQGLRGKPQEGLPALEQALHLAPRNQDAWFWKGMIYAYLGQNTVAIESIEQALHNGLPPILLTPLFWLKQESSPFYQEYAKPLLERYELL